MTNNRKKTVKSNIIKDELVPFRASHKRKADDIDDTEVKTEGDKDTGVIGEVEVNGIPLVVAPYHDYVLDSDMVSVLHVPPMGTVKWTAYVNEDNPRIAVLKYSWPTTFSNLDLAIPMVQGSSHEILKTHFSENHALESAIRRFKKEAIGSLETVIQIPLPFPCLTDSKFTVVAKSQGEHPKAIICRFQAADSKLQKLSHSEGSCA